MSWIGGTGFIDIRLQGLLPLWMGAGGFGGLGGNYGVTFPTRRSSGVYTPWSPDRRAAVGITTSPDLPGSTHWDPAPVPVGEQNGGTPAGGGIVLSEGAELPWLGVLLPHVIIEDEPPIIFQPAPIILPGQTDPGREEHESEEGPMAHTWRHLGSQVISGIFGGQDAYDVGAGSGFNLGGGGGTGGGGGNGDGVGYIPAPAGDPMYTGSCPPRKTRTLTIDCATGQEIKRKRRRRRALLTQGDMGVLFQIASLPNNANVRVALAGAIRR